MGNLAQRDDLNPSPDTLRVEYKAMSDPEMLKLGDVYSSLTDNAQQVVREEFARRTLPIPEAPDEADDAAATQSVTTIRQYRDQPEALLARGLLQSAGIDCYLRDENTIRIDWLWSNLMGGIRLQVATEDVAAAEAVLSQPIPESIALSADSEYQQPACPRCRSLDLTYQSSSNKAAASSILLLGFPIPSPATDAWTCNQCGLSWQDDDDIDDIDDIRTTV